jgi:hypothetical protein
MATWPNVVSADRSDDVVDRDDHVFPREKGTSGNGELVAHICWRRHWAEPGCSIVAMLLFGSMGVALYLRKARPDIYDRIGRTVFDDTDDSVDEP